jgi:hypothetical protein
MVPRHRREQADRRLARLSTLADGEAANTGVGDQHSIRRRARHPGAGGMRELDGLHDLVGILRFEEDAGAAHLDVVNGAMGARFMIDTKCLSNAEMRSLHDILRVRVSQQLALAGDQRRHCFVVCADVELVGSLRQLPAMAGPRQ